MTVRQVGLITTKTVCKLSKTALSLKRAKAAPAAASQTKTAVAPKMHYDDEEKTEQDNECTFLSTVQKVKEYMIKADERQLQLASVVGIFDGQVQITIRGERREVRGFSRLIRVFKAHLHKTAKRMPRVSDPDFKEGNFSDDEPGKPMLPIDKTADGIRAVWLDTQPKVKDVIDSLEFRCSGISGSLPQQIFIVL